ncbi:uncharacterized protein [Drosophila kikkawai]|uniref:Integrase catalytic domain-containing protein n=1 Tax=Drosophila kikkawai TaxID=30033 RepID=A0ABM3C4S6_DROKI|nr:uncharacterized protein LOC121502058 [Drosophila kikkawai]
MNSIMHRTIQQRGACKGQLTRTLNSATDFAQRCDCVQTLQHKLERLVATFNHFMELSDDLVEFNLEDGYEDPGLDIPEYEEKFYSAHAIFSKAIKEMGGQDYGQDQSNLLISSTVERLFEGQNQLLEQIHTSSSATDLRFEKIRIPTFSGKYEDWSQFSDLFLSSVNNNEKLSKCQKFHYLKSYLDGEALSLIKHIAVCNDNYQDAWEKLENRYNKKSLIARSFVQNFLSLPTANNLNIAELRKIVDSADECIRGLHALNCDSRDVWLIHILLSKLGSEVKQAWANCSMSSKEDVTIYDLFTFLFAHCDTLESCQDLHALQPSRPAQSRRRQVTYHASGSNQPPRECIYCQGQHNIYSCTEFQALDVGSRRTFVRDTKLCFNCLSRSHQVSDCNSSNTCRQCNARHHTLVHPEESRSIPSASAQMSAAELNTTSSFDHAADMNTAAISHHTVERANNQALLPTILANVIDACGNTTSCRLLLDTGSTITMVSESFIQRIGISRSHARISVVGLGASPAGVSRGRATFTLLSRTTTASVEVTGLIMSSLTSLLPAQQVKSSSSIWNKIRRLPLADPTFGAPGKIDVILGADQLWNIYTGHRREFGIEYPIALHTNFGWVITGSYSDCNEASTQAQVHHAYEDLDSLVRSFMDMEQVHPTKATIDASDPAEQHFLKTHARTEDGVYIVQYPFKEPIMPIGSTLPQALNRFAALERKFRKFPALKQQYVDFMEDYLRRGHMELIPATAAGEDPARYNYLAHHAVFKPDSTTTRCRVVFDGSGNDSKGHSLNSRLHIGPPIQRDLLGVCLRFRQHRYVFCADIEKMFRGILVADEHTHYQRIVWRKEETATLDHYRLLTVTYGLASSPFIAVRVLKQLATDYAEMYPNAAVVLNRDAYVDDIPTGCDKVEDLIALKDELILLLSEAHFNLRKWSSNCCGLLKSLPKEICEYPPNALENDSPFRFVKVLGVCWEPKTDHIFFKLSPPGITTALTKRILLSELAKIYDPLGLLAPTTVFLKILFQDSWLSSVEWSEVLHPHLCFRWQQFVSEMHLLETCRVPRYISTPSQAIELHGFADASSQAFAAVIYSRFKVNAGYAVNLIMAKTRVAPIKPISIPRLELNAAHLLSKLISLVKQSLTIPISRINCWSDSEIVLHWLSSPPRTWNTYVCNRTAEILDGCPRSCWQHIRSEDNPADCASRGILPKDLVDHQIWWNGPAWLSQSRSAWPPAKAKFALSTEEEACLEVKAEHKVNLHISDDGNSLNCMINKISSWSRLIRILSYCFRFVHRFRGRTPLQPFLAAWELQYARSRIFAHVQKEFFSMEYTQLSTGQQLSKKSKLIRYTPFLDEQGIMRVGGRIDNSLANYDAKHPIILPKESPIAATLILYQHSALLHAGVEYTFHSLRQRYWILGARNLVRKTVFNCRTCFLQRRHTASQLMADLPEFRVQPARCFLHTGLDYAGPVSIKISTGRTPKFGKAWFAIFVCLSTKAIHIELVSDLTTSAFIAAFQRFWSRRGPISDLYSDNGTTFHGAKKELAEMQQIAISQSQNEEISSFLSTHEVNWHFIPPSAPHFGGIWETGVRSIKLHLKRVVGSSALTFEEYSTLLIQIEGLLNSRPLCAPSDHSLNPLTPSHFLTGQPLTSVPEPSLLDVNINRLQRWRELQAKVQGFWKRWNLEYLNTLQARTKWQQDAQDIAMDTLVVLKEPNQPPSKWLLGRVVEVHPGQDQRVRVVTVKTARGTYKRPITKIAVLPLN